MAINPMTKQLRQDLRAASMDRNDEKAFALICKILELDPGDTDILDQRKAVGRRLFDKNVKELGALIDAGDNAKLVQAIQEMERYVDRDYAIKCPVYVEANAIVQECLRIQAEEDLREKFKAFEKIKDLQERDKEAGKLEKFATNAGLQLDKEQRKLISSAREAWKKQLEFEKQMQKLNDLSARADDLGDRVELLKQDYSHEQYNGLMMELAECSGVFSTLTSPPADMLEAARNRFCTIQEQARAARLAHVKKIRKRFIIKSSLSLAILAVAGGAIYLFCTVKGKVDEIKFRLNKMDVQYIQEVSASFSSRLYSLVSQDFASELERCKQFLSERDRQQALFKETVGKLEVLGNNISKATCALYSAELGKLEEIRKQYFLRFNEELDPSWEAHRRDYLQPLNKYYDSRVEYYRSVSPSMSIGEIISMFNEFKSEASAFPEELAVDIAVGYTHAVVTKYGRYSTMDDRQLETSIQEVRQAVTAGLPLDESFLRNLLSEYAGRNAVADIERNLHNALDLNGYVGVIRRNSVGYGALDSKYPLEALIALADHEDEVKSGAKLLMLDIISGNTKRVRANSDIGSLAQLSKLRDVFYGRTDAYMGSKSSTMNAIIRELTTSRSDIWGGDASLYMLENKGNIYIGRMSSLNENKTIITVDKKHKVKFRSGERLTNLYQLRKSVGITAKALDEGRILPVDILHRIAAMNDGNTPALARVYLYGKVKELILNYRNQAASGYALCPTLRQDFDDFECRKLGAVGAGSWLTPYPESLERECRYFLQTVASHDYLAEIKQNIQLVERAELVFTGYVQKDGSPHYTKTPGGNPVYFYSVTSDSFEVYTKDKHLDPFTPLFTLSGAPKR